MTDGNLRRMSGGGNRQSAGDSWKIGSAPDIHPRDRVLEAGSESAAQAARGDRARAFAAWLLRARHRAD